VSKVLGVVASIASIAALIPGPHQGAARIIATVASVGSAILAKPPPAKGSVNQIQIGANMPSPYAMGRTYIGGNMVHEAGYGGSANPYKSFVLVWSVGGPIHSIESFQADFSPITFSGGNAVGYYQNFLYLSTSLGARPQATALAGPFGAIPGWGAASKMSGKTHGMITQKFDKKGKRFASGQPQYGVVGKWVLAYDPRKDSTYPGGSGTHRFDDEATWEWTENPGLHAITYARGRYENGKKVFGCGYSKEGIDIPAFVAFANICDLNEWVAGGVIHEPGSRKDNLKYILEAGGAEPVFGPKLSVRYQSPKLAADTIQADDLADGDYIIPAMLSWRDRVNSIVPKYRSPDHKWEYVQSDAITIAEYVTEDGEEKPVERQWSLVQDKDQVAQLASYALLDRREITGITLSLKPRFSAFKPGQILECGASLAELGLAGLQLEILKKAVDPATAIVTLTLQTYTAGKHAFALGKTGTAPPTPAIVTAEQLDTIIAANRSGAPLEVATEAALLTLEVEPGRTVIRTDLNKSYEYNGGTSGTMADWTEVVSPAPNLAPYALLAAAAFTGPVSVAGTMTASEGLAVSGAGSTVKFALSASGAIATISGVTSGDTAYARVNMNAITSINFNVGTAGFVAPTSFQAVPGGLNLPTGKIVTVNSQQVIGARGAAVADAAAAAAAPTQAEFNALVTQVNTLLARLRAGTGHGLIA
jgi:hypothetical protein